MNDNTAGSNQDISNQVPPFVDVNLFTSDTALQEAVVREGGAKAVTGLEAFGRTAGSAAANELQRLAEENPPRLRAFDPQGQRIDRVEFHPAYHRLMGISTGHGLHCSTFEHLAGDGAPRHGAHVGRCAAGYMATQMEAGHCCSITMTHAAIAALGYAPSLIEDMLPKLLKRGYDPRFLPWQSKDALTIGIGVVERQGGSDVRSNTTSAARVEGVDGASLYTITGHKWFLSAPMSDAFLVLAQAGGGLSAFLVPRVMPDGSANGIRLERLKDKLGNRSNASAEASFDRALGFLVGEEGRGVVALSDMVTLTRLDCAISSAGLVRQALSRAIHHARHRSAFQKRLIQQPLMRQVLADMALDVEAAATFVFRLARSFDGGKDETETAYRRLMTPVAKYWVCKLAPGIAAEAMECLGGNGYVEEGGMPRLYREAPFIALWEGSGNLLCLDVLRVFERFPETLDRVLAECEGLGGGEIRLKAALREVRTLSVEARKDEALARVLTERLALISAGALLLAHAPAAISDAFLATRLAGDPKQTYGASLARADLDAILGRASPISG